MLIGIYLYAFIGICLGLLTWGLLRPARVYQYPFFMGGIFFAFLAPQTISLVWNQGPLSTDVIERVLLMSCLCAAMCWLGYQFKPKEWLLEKLDFEIDRTKLLYGGITFVLISYYCEYQIASTVASSAVQVTEAGGWTGIVTVYAFFGSLAFPGFIIILMHTLRYPRISNFVLTFFAALPPLRLLIIGRRQPAATLLVTIGLALFFHRRLVPPRWLVVGMILLTLIAVPMIGQYRNIASSGNWGELLELRPAESMRDYIEQGDILELRNAAYVIENTLKTGDYRYGTGFWDMIAFNFVPAQFVGTETKKAVLFNWGNNAFESIFAMGYDFAPGSTITGVGDAFLEFDYFGCLFFFLSAYFFKHLWFSAFYRSSLFSRILYTSLFAPMLVAVTHGVVTFASALMFNFVFLGAVVLYARKKPHPSAQRSSWVSDTRLRRVV